MKTGILITFLMIFGMFSLAFSQETSRTKSRKQRLEEAIYGNALFPSVSAAMMPKGFLEINSFNSLLTSTKVFTSNKSKEDLLAVNTFYFNTLLLTYGISESGRLNLGLDLGYTAFRSDSQTESSPLKVFGSDFTTVYGQKKDFTTFTARVRFMPVEDNNKLVIQSGFSFPIANQRIQNFTGQNRIAWNNQVLYNFQLGEKFYLFSQLDLRYYFKKDDTYKATLSVPLSVFASYMVGTKILPFVSLTRSSVFGATADKKFSLFSHASLYGLGLQFQPSLRFSLNAYFSNTFEGKNTNIWKSYNLGVRVVI